MGSPKGPQPHTPPRRRLLSTCGSMRRIRSIGARASAAPPAKLTVGIFADRWRDQELRLQRLHQIIDELTDKWT
jgi:hypothetical protein